MSRWMIPAAWARVSARAVCPTTVATSSVAPEARVEILALEHLHHDVRQTRHRLTRVEDLHDVRALELGDGVGFPKKPSEHRGALGGEGRIDELDGDARLQTDVLRFPDRAHAPFAEKALEANARCDLESGVQLHRDIL